MDPKALENLTTSLRGLADKLLSLRDDAARKGLTFHGEWQALEQSMSTLPAVLNTAENLLSSAGPRAGGPAPAQPALPPLEPEYRI